MKVGFKGLPVVGATSRTLGARPNTDIALDGKGYVETGNGGMSVTVNDFMKLPDHKLPRMCGGEGRDPVFKTEAEGLPETLLITLDDRPSSYHGLVEPSQRCLFSVYQEELHQTRPKWRKIECQKHSKNTDP